MSSARAPEPGELLGGRYRLGVLLGRGGMATVHRAVDEHLGRDVALKLFRVDGADGEAERMASEVRLLAALRHPSLVTVHDAATDGDGHPFLVMELIEGPSLGERIAAGPLPADEVRSIAAELAEALHVVHAARVVHRDVKPSNILLDPVPTGRGHRAKLADFGIARLADSTRLTLPGTVVGTAAYLSPEQARGQEPGTPADVYALGLVLLEALTGQRAYPQAALQDALIARLNGPPLIPGSLGYGWKSLLTAMTLDDPAARPTALEVATRVDALNEAADAGAAALPGGLAATGATGAMDATGPMDATAAMSPTGAMGSTGANGQPGVTAPAGAVAATGATVAGDAAEPALPPTSVLPAASHDATDTLQTTSATAPSRRARPRWLVPAALALVLLLGGGAVLTWSLAQDATAVDAPSDEADPGTPAPAPSESTEQVVETEPTEEAEPAQEADPVQEPAQPQPEEPASSGKGGSGPGNSDAGHANGKGNSGNGNGKGPKG